MIKFMKKAELRDCLDVIEDKLDIIIYSPQQLSALLDEWLARDEGLKFNAIQALLEGDDIKREAVTARREAVDARRETNDIKERHRRGPKAKTVKAHARRDFIRERSLKLQEEAKQKGSELTWANAKVKADALWVKNEREAGRRSAPYSESSLDRIARNKI